MNKDASKTVVELKYPVTSDGTELKCLHIRRPKVRDSLAAAKLGGTDEEKEIRYLANLCEIATDVIESLDISDFRKLQEAYRDFLS